MRLTSSSMNQAHSDITFLDLTGVGDEERQTLLSSLRTENPCVQLPWTNSRNKSGQQHSQDEQASVNSCVMVSPPYLQNCVPNQTEFIYSNGQQNYAYPPTTLYPVLPVNYAGHYTIPMVYTSMPSDDSYRPQLNVNAPSFTPIEETNCSNGISYIQPAVTAVPPVVFLDNATTPSEVGVEDDCAEAAELLPAQTVIEPEIVQDENVQSVSQSSSQKSVKEQVNGSDETQVQPDSGTDDKKSTSPESTGRKSWASLFVAKSLNGEVPGTGNKLTKTVKKTVDNAHVYPIQSNVFVDPSSYRMGEYLLNRKVDGRVTSLQPRGLINHSSYCYINSILQSLLACPPLYNLLVDLSEHNGSAPIAKKSPIIDAMCRFVKEFRQLPASLRVKRRNSKNQRREMGANIDYDVPFEPFWIHKILNGTSSNSFMIEGRQEDAEEFLGYLLNGLNDEMVDLMNLARSNANKIEDHANGLNQNEWHLMGPKSKGANTRQIDVEKTPINDIFRGSLKSKIQRNGDQPTFTVQPFITLQLNIGKVKTVHEALEALASKTRLEGVTSSKTNKEVEAWQQVTLEDLPVILVLHLKCFNFRSNGCRKIVKALEFPIDLKIDQKLLTPKPTSPKERQYKLFAVTYHDGREATKGHYITDAFHVGYNTWIRYDDASVKAIPEDNLLQPQGTRVPYLLFYRRCDTIKSK